MQQRARLSRKFIERVKSREDKSYILARTNDTLPGTFSRWIHGRRAPCVDDPRIIAIGRRLGLQPDECFESLVDEPETSR